MKYIIGNWKANKNLREAEQWFSEFNRFWQEKSLSTKKIEIVLCPPFVLLPLVKELKEKYRLPIKLGAQDVSPYPNGAFTGEITASHLKDFVEYVIIGHSERRKYFKEDEKMLSLKVQEAKKAGLKVIFCVPDEKTFIPSEVFLVAYEPVWAIGSGKADSPFAANQIARIIKEKRKGNLVIYGGSVTSENVASFLNEKEIDGVLPGKASLSSLSFFEIITHATTIV